MVTVYLVSAEIDNSIVYKIGHTRRKPEDRIREFKTGNASSITLINSYQSKWGTKIESFLHRQFKSKRLNGEWFALDELDVKSFQNLCELSNNNFMILSEHNSYIQDRKLL